MNSATPKPLDPLAAEALRLDAQLCFALYSTGLAMNKAYRPLLADLGLTYPQYLVMLLLWEGDGLGVGELGERLFLDSATLTPLLKRLEAAGLIVRTRDSVDERRVLVSLSAAGQALRQRAAAVPPQIMAATGCGLDELRELKLKLEALRGRLQSAG